MENPRALPLAKKALYCVGDVGALFVARAVTPPDILIRHPFG